MEIQKFNPTVAEIKAAVLEVEGLTISGVDDEAGYAAVKVGKKRLADYRIEITKFGKQARQGLLEAQRDIIRQEKELLEMITPTENKLKSEMEAIDEEKKRAERAILLPSRKKMLEELQDIIPMISDDEIVALDEKEFSEYYTSKKMAYLEEKDNRQKAKEAEEKRLADLEEARKEAAANAKKEAEEKAERDKIKAAEKAEKDKQDAIKKIKQDQADKEKAEADQLAAEKADQKKIEKNRKYKAWLKENGYTEETKDDFVVKKESLNDETIFTLYKKIDTIIIE